MFIATYRASVIVFAAVAFLYLPRPVIAQIAPTASATISGSVSDSTGKPLVNTKVSLSGAKNTVTQTDGQGLFVFVGVPFGTYNITAMAMGLGTATRLNIVVQGDTNVAIQYEPASVNGLKTIASVSASANARFNVTPASITQVDPIANAFEGKTSWRTILEQIPGVAQAGLLSGNLELASIPDSPFVPVQISINGALPYETATLVDDMPLIGGSSTFGFSLAGGGTDLGLYALNSFGAADVVRGPGASAPSIVDSIGGSFVLHAPGAVTSDHSTFSFSTDPYGGIVANAQIAMHLKKLSVIVTYGINDSPGPTNSASIPGVTIFSPSTVNGSTFACTGSCPVGYLLNQNYAAAAFPYYGFSNGLLTCCVQQSTAWSQHSGSIALDYQFSPSVSAELFYTGQASNQACSTANFAIDFTPPAGYTGSLPSGEQFLSLSEEGLAPSTQRNASSLLEEKITARLGAGILRLAALQNRDFIALGLSSSTGLSQQLFGSGTLCATSTPACGSAGNPGTPTVFNGGTYNVTYPLYTLTDVFDSNNRDLLFGYTTPLSDNLHAGVSFVQSYYNIPSVGAYNIGGCLLGGGIPAAVSQATNEFRVFVGGAPSGKTSLDVSMYFADADYHVQNPADVSGNTYVDKRYNYAAPRLGFVWRPTASVAFRAAAGGGFAEAPLGDLEGNTYVFSGNGTPFCSSGICTVTLTNLNLQPEKSFGFDLGTDIRLSRATVLSFDVYHTNLYGQFYASTSTQGSCPTCGGLPLFTTQYGNLGESRYEGALLDLRHDVPHGVYWALSGGLTRGYVVSVPPGFYNAAGATCNTATNSGCTNVTVVPNVNFNGTFTAVSVPYSQALGKFGYRWSSEKYIDLVGTYYGNGNTYFRPAFVELDGDISYPLTKNSSLLVTFRNITGIYDGSTQIFSPANMSGAPTIAGLPYPLYGENYGPRTVILTTRISL